MKTILVVDIGNDEYLLNKKINAICFEDGDKIYDNFNFLKPMPKKKDINYAEKTSDGYYTLFSKQYVNGFNACIDEILESNRRNRMTGQNYDKEKALLAIQHLAGIIKEMHKSLETTTYEPARNYARRSIEACHWAIDVLINALTEGEENERVD